MSTFLEDRRISRAIVVLRLDLCDMEPKARGQFYTRDDIGNDIYKYQATSNALWPVESSAANAARWAIEHGHGREYGLFRLDSIVTAGNVPVHFERIGRR